MNLDPILNAPLEIQIHMLFALPALIFTPIAMFRTRRDGLHKLTGYLGVIGMIGLAVSGLFIESGMALVWHFGPIHLLSALTLHGVGEGLYYIWKRDLKAHRQAMQGLFFGAVGLATSFTFLPGRTMNRVLFGEPSDLGWVIVAVAVIAVTAFRARWFRKPLSEAMR